MSALLQALSALTNPAVLIMVAVAYSGGYWRGHAGASGACNVASLKAEIGALRADNKAAIDAAARFEAEARANTEIAAKNDKIIEEMRHAPNPACRLSDSDADRLRGIR
jgi:acetyl-CoA carboxylase carboxyltransferase component